MSDVLRPVCGTAVEIQDSAESTADLGKAYELIGRFGSEIEDSGRIAYYPYGGYNLLLVYYLNKYTGGPSSTLSISRKLADAVFPIEDREIFRIRADDVVVFSSSMMKEMFFIDKQLTEYRLHGDNRFVFRYQEDSSLLYKRELAIHRLKKKILGKLKIDKRFLENPYNVYNEFKTKHKIDSIIFKTYVRLLLLEINAPLSKKVKVLEKLFDLYEQRRTYCKLNRTSHF
jgi:hypothetical protein